MHNPRKKNLLAYAKALRKKMTKEERHLWYDFLRYCTPRFRRQEIIGNYIADFYCSKAKLVIELDGSQHMNQVILHTMPKEPPIFIPWASRWFDITILTFLKILKVSAKIF